MLLRRSCCCDGVAAATELRGTSSVALILRVASLGRDAQNAETAQSEMDRKQKKILLEIDCSDSKNSRIFLPLGRTL